MCRSIAFTPEKAATSLGSASHVELLEALATQLNSLPDDGGFDSHQSSSLPEQGSWDRDDPPPELREEESKQKDETKVFCSIIHWLALH